MLSKEILIKQIPVLKSIDKGSLALSLMEEYKLKHLPVVDNGKYTCLITERDVYSMENLDNQIKGFCLFAPCIQEKTHILEALRIMSHDELTLLPVTDSEGQFIGVITLSALIEKLTEITNAGSYGALIAIELNPQDYDLSNIVRLVESNNSKVLSLFSYPVKETAKLIVILKIDSEDASAVLRSFERFDYSVIYYFRKQGLIDDIQRKRLEELIYYLQM